jgi:hypothetical protein
MVVNNWLSWGYFAVRCERTAHPFRTDRYFAASKLEISCRVMNRNPWMKMPIDKWEGLKAMDRVLKLRDGFLQAMENIIISRKVTA